MYTSYKTYTIKCAAGTTGTDVTQGASADSVISQRDADVKALGLAQRLAYEFLVCQFPPDPDVVIYCSLPVSKSAAAQAGYQPQTFTVNFGACAVYSTTSQADADAAAALAAQLEAEHERDVGQKRIYYSVATTFTNSCTAIMGPLFDPATITFGVNAGDFQSFTSQAHADYLAYNYCVSVVFSQAHNPATCTPFWLSAAVSYTATCVGPLVGTAVKVTYPYGQIKSYISQADADALALAGATAAATALIVCIVGFYNTAQSYTAKCVDFFGDNWIGTDVTVTVPAGAYVDTTLAAANATALAAATIQAASALICRWGGGLEP